MTFMVVVLWSIDLMPIAVAGAAFTPIGTDSVNVGRHDANPALRPAEGLGERHFGSWSYVATMAQALSTSRPYRTAFCR